MTVDIYIPTFGRSQKLREYISHVRESVSEQHRVVCIVERHDMDSYNESVAAGAITIINHRTPNYAGAINSAWECLLSDAFFAGADDLRFIPGWLDWALDLMTDKTQVVGTNDLHNQEVVRGEHATHYLVDGKYIKDQCGVIDKGAPVLFEEYDHNWTDREFIGTAKYRGAFSPCLESLVEHLHFTFGLSKIDETYKKTRLRVDADGALYQKRKQLWAGM